MECSCKTDFPVGPCSYGGGDGQCQEVQALEELLLGCVCVGGTRNPGWTPAEASRESRGVPCVKAKLPGPPIGRLYSSVRGTHGAPVRCWAQGLLLPHCLWMLARLESIHGVNTFSCTGVGCVSSVGVVAARPCCGFSHGVIPKSRVLAAAQLCHVHLPGPPRVPYPALLPAP